MQNKKTNDTDKSNSARHVRVVLPGNLDRRLRHVAVDRDVAVGALIVEAAQAYAPDDER